MKAGGDMNKLKQRRVECGFKQSCVAKAAGITTSCYQMYEYEKRLPRVDVAIKIAAALGSTAEKLFG